MAKTTKHEFSARNLALLQRNSQIDVVLGDQLTRLEVSLSIDPADVGIEVGRFLGQRQFAFSAGGTTELNRFVEGFEPHVQLLGQGRVGGDLKAIGIDIDMAFKRAGALGVGDFNGGIPILILVARPADGMAGIAVFKEIDLVEFAFGVFVRVGRHTVVNRQGNVAVFKEGDDIVHILERSGAKGDDAGLAGSRDALEQQPVVGIGTGDLDDRHVEIDAPIDGFFVERGCHGNAAALFDGLDHDGVVFLGHLGVHHALDVADIGAITKILVHKAVHVSELELDGGAHVVEADHAAVLMHNIQGALEAALVIIGHFKNEQVFKDITIHIGS